MTITSGTIRINVFNRKWVFYFYFIIGASYIKQNDGHVHRFDHRWIIWVRRSRSFESDFRVSGRARERERDVPVGRESHAYCEQHCSVSVGDKSPAQPVCCARNSNCRSFSGSHGSVDESLRRTRL